MAFTNITITGTYKKPGGAVDSGWISLTPTSVLINGTDIRAPVPTWVALDGTGTISQVVVATDDAGTTPAGVTYTVTELINNASPKTYNITVPSGSPGGTLDLSSVIPVTNLATGMADGTVSAPALRFLSELTSGIYRIGAGIIGVSILGVERLRISATELLVSAAMRMVNRAAPGTPAAGTVTLYTSTADKKLHSIDDTGTDVAVGGFTLVKVANDFAGANLGAKIVAADVSLGASVGEIWIYGGGDFGTTAITINDGHSLRFGPGTYTCNIAVASGSQFLFGSNLSITGAGWGAIITESPYFDLALPSYPANGIFKAAGGNNSSQINVTISGIHFLGAKIWPYSLSGATVNFNNSRNCATRDCIFENTTAYCTQFGGGSGRQESATVVGASNTTSIVITTSAPHSFYENEKVEVVGVGGNTAANGFFYVQKVYSNTQFLLYSSVGNGAYTSGGTVYGWKYADGGWMERNLCIGCSNQNLVLVNGRNIHCNDNIFLRPAAKRESIVNTNGTAVTWVAGDSLIGFVTGRAIVINGIQYTTTGTATATSVTLTTSAGVQTNVPCDGDKSPVSAVDFEPNGPNDIVENYEICRNVFDYRGSGATSSATTAIAVQTAGAVSPFAGRGPGLISGNTIVANDPDITPEPLYMLQGAILCNGHRHVTISNNVIRGPWTIGITANGDKYTITGNSFFDIRTDGSGAAGIKATGLTDSYIANNRFERSQPDTRSSITEDGTSNNNVYSNNIGLINYVSLQPTSRVLSGLSGTATWAPGNVLNGGFDSTTVTVTGARVGDRVLLGFTTAVPAGLLLTAHVTAAATVTASLFNMSGAAVQLASGTLTADVRQ